MTAKGNRRNVPVRLAEPSIALIETMAADEGLTRADMIRTLLVEAIQARQAKKRSRT